MEFRSRLIGVGSYLPEKILTNDELPAILETSHEWIMERTGIAQRHIADTNELTSDLGCQAALKALEYASISAQSIDLIIVATSTPDRTFPSTAVEIQSKLGIYNGFAFDLQAVCSGFLYALITADNFIKTGSVKRVLVIGAEIFSRIVDWNDRSTCILFGDGAGAVIMQAEHKLNLSNESGILVSKLYSDGRYGTLLNTDGGPAISEKVGKIHMQGREVFKHAVEKMSSVSAEVLNQSGYHIDDIAKVIPHQANTRILQSVSKKLNCPYSKIISTIDKHANTSAASIPLALDYGIRTELINNQDLILLMALGAGFTWGSAILRF